jgi:uncharacterized protein (TIGR03435 family)
MPVMAGPLMLALAGLPLQAQSPALPEFEVASVKPSNPKGGGAIGCFTYPGGRVTVGNSTLEMLIEYAFGVQQFQISGGPPWIHDDRFNLEAIPPSTSKSSAAKPPSPKAPLNQEQREMLQALLLDRFQLKIHHEAKTGPVYLLTIGKGPLKLKEAKDKGDFLLGRRSRRGNDQRRWNRRRERLDADPGRTAKQIFEGARC